MAEKERWKFGCSEHSCQEGHNDIPTLIHRISAKGGPFVGLCEQHYKEWESAKSMNKALESRPWRN